MASSFPSFTWEWVDGVTWAKADWAHNKSSSEQLLKFACLSTASPQKGTFQISLVNFTDRVLGNVMLSVLGKGLNFAPTPKTPPLVDYISAIEEAVRPLPSDATEEIRHETCRVLTKATPLKNNISSSERGTLHELCEDPHTVVLPADKGNAMVLLQWNVYNKKIDSLLGESTQGNNDWHVNVITHN